MADDSSHDLVVIGGGPGGYVAAIRGAQLGLDVACIDEHAELGGTCLRVGCIPSKALLESSERYERARDELAEHGISAKVKLDLPVLLERKQKIVSGLTQGVSGLLKKHGVTVYRGRGRLVGQGTVEVVPAEGEPIVLAAEHVLIATGSRSTSIPSVELDGERVVTSNEALAFDQVPKHLVVIGAGYIGLELGSVWRRLGAQVTVVEALDRVLPALDAEIAGLARKSFEEQGLEFRLGSRVQSARARGKGARVELVDGDPIDANRVLLAVGRTPCTDGLGLDEAGVDVDERGFIVVDPDSYETSAPGVFAIGDVIGEPMLAHKASDEGIACVERLVTGYGHVDYDSIPAVVYTHPEIGTVGRTAEQLEADGIEYRTGKYRLRNNPRARCLGEPEGLIKVLADAATDRILGVHIIGARAGDLIAEAAVAMAFSASSEDLARACHAHPTLSEALREAALAVDGRALHG